MNTAASPAIPAGSVATAAPPASVSPQRCDHCFSSALAFGAHLNFDQLADDSGVISEDSLHKILSHSRNCELLKLARHLDKALSKLGHQEGVRKSTTYFAAGQCAMPVTFARPNYVISREDLKVYSVIP